MGAVVARVGSLEVLHPFLPDPASPTVAAVYLTVRNLGSSPDALLGASTPTAPSAMLMTEDEHGLVGMMAPLDRLTIPPHREASLSPGHDHLMLQPVSQTLRVGQAVRVTLHFAKAGPLTLSVPVVPLAAILNDDAGGGR